jgi:hypothetical protein
MSDEVDKISEGIKSLATPLQDLILGEAIKDREYANKAARELSALHARIEELEKDKKSLSKELLIYSRFLGPEDWEEVQALKLEDAE